MPTLQNVKTALRIMTNDFDDEIEMLMDTALLDLGLAGVTAPESSTLQKLTDLAVITFVKCHFGNPENYDRLKRSYDEQKAQLSMATGFTEWVHG